MEEAHSDKDQRRHILLEVNTYHKSSNKAYCIVVLPKDSSCADHLSLLRILCRSFHLAKYSENSVHSWHS